MVAQAGSALGWGSRGRKFESCSPDKCFKAFDFFKGFAIYSLKPIFQKFLLHLPLREMLLETGDKYIEETNYWKDTYWGVCDGIGENNLGKIIMATREYFKKQK